MPALDLDNQISLKMKGLPVAIDVLAALTRISRTVIGNACRGIAPLGTERSLKIWGVLRELQELKDRARPFVAPFNNLAAIENLLEELREAKSRPVTLLSEPEARLLHKFASGTDLDDLLAESSQTREEFLQTIGDLLRRTSRQVLAVNS